MSTSRAIGLLNDFSKALGQQLFFWGCDVVHPDGNLLCEFGFEKYRRNGVSGSSCYRVTHDSDVVELHSLCVGRYGIGSHNLLYSRHNTQCYVYEGNTPPSPDNIDRTLLHTSVDQLEVASRRFLEWWLTYEHWIASRTHAEYRANCHRSFKKVTKTRLWLRPNDALSWLQMYMDSPTSVPRAKQWRRTNPRVHPHNRQTSYRLLNTRRH